jgi:hypothetical protein
MNIRILCIASSFALMACSGAKPHTGETVTQTEMGSGVTVTQLESRSMLSSGELAGTDAMVTKVVAKVAAVDVKSRLLTILTGDGRMVEMVAGPEVRNLAQVNPGDQVVLAIVESIDFEVREPTAEEKAMVNEAAVIAGRTPQGSSPGAFVSAGQTKILVVDSLNQDKGLVTFKDGDRLFTVKAKYPQNLKTVKSGDTVVVTMSEAIAASIQPVL